MNNFLKKIRVSYKEKCGQIPVSGSASLYKLMQSRTFESQVQKMLSIRDERLQKLYKQKTFPVFFNTVFEGQALNQHADPAHVIMADIDADQNPGMNLKEAIRTFKQLPYVAGLAVSIRGRGLYVVIKIIPIKNPERFKNIYRSVEQDFKALGYTIDPSCKNLNRARFFGYSRYVWFRPTEPTVYRPKRAAKAARIECPVPGEVVRLHIGSPADYEAVKMAIELIEGSCLDIAYSYAEYFSLALSFANAFGEKGRPLFHRVCAISEKYDYDDADYRYSNALETGGNAHTLGTFYYLCERVGLSYIAIISYRRATQLENFRQKFLNNHLNFLL